MGREGDGKPAAGAEPARETVSVEAAGRSAFTAGIAVEEWQRLAAFEVRIAVFVEEQLVPIEEEWDSYDPIATHIVVSLSGAETQDPGSIIATARLFEKEEGVGKVGRVAVLKPYRRQGVGSVLMRCAEEIARRRRYRTLILDSQCTAIPFYEQLGYRAEGPVFLDAGIDHRRMRKELTGHNTLSNT
jgi:predicted GNAT family N-acyltransferase